MFKVKRIYESKRSPFHMLQVLLLDEMTVGMGMMAPSCSNSTGFHLPFLMPPRCCCGARSQSIPN